MRIRLLLIVSIVLLAAPLLWAQSDTATISGRVTDQSGSIVPGALIKVEQVGTGIQRTTTTNAEGLYSFPGLRVGEYRMAVTRDGFAQVIKTGVVLHVQDESAQNFELRVGSTTESITVTADAVHVDTAPGLSSVVDQRFVENMPLNGRTIQSLLALTPGLRTVGTGLEGQLSANGLRTTMNYFTIDGVSANIGVAIGTGVLNYAGGGLPGFSVIGTSNNLVSVDALQEFKVQTSAFSAEFGRQPGAQVQMTTRSGGNQFHGTASEYFRNDVFDAADWFVNANRLVKPPERNNDFAGTLGGPIRRDKTFFFVSYEGLRLRLPGFMQNSVMCNELRAQAAPALQPYMKNFPQPTGPCDLTTMTAPFATAYSDKVRLDSTGVRIDHVLTKKITIFGRYQYSPNHNYLHYTFANNYVNYQQNTTRTFTAGATMTLSPTMTNELRYNWSNNWGGTEFVPSDLGGATPVSNDLLTIGGYNPSNSRVSLSFMSFAGGLNQGQQGDNTTHQQNVTDTFSKVWGKHTFKAGGDYRFFWPEIHPPDYDLSSSFSTPDNIRTGIADAFVLYWYGHEDFKYHNLSLFVQDSWKVGRRLTLDYGLRWDYNASPSMDPAPMLVVGLANMATATMGQKGLSFYNAPKKDFGPRVGVAYNLRDKSSWETVLRGGYGLYYDIGTGMPMMDPSLYPYTNSVWLYNVPFPFAHVTVPDPAMNPPYPSNLYIGQYSPDYVNPRVHQWNVTVEQAIGRDQKLTVSYVGNAGRRLLRLMSASNGQVKNPNFVSGAYFYYNVNSPGIGDVSNYKAMQVQFVRRTNRIQATVNYTLSHAQDSSSSDRNNVTPLGAVSWYRSATDYADSNFDRRHLFSTAVSVDLPALGNAGRVVQKVTKGWSIEGLVQAYSAAPINPYYNTSGILPGGASFFFRPDLVSGAALWISDPTIPMGKRINPAAFATLADPLSRSGNMPRNGIRAWGFWQPDLAVRRQFGITERLKLQFKVEAFNALNHPNFALPGIRLGTLSASGKFTPVATFGKATAMLKGGGGGINSNDYVTAIYSSGNARSVQFSLKLIF